MRNISWCPCLKVGADSIPSHTEIGKCVANVTTNQRPRLSAWWARQPMGGAHLRTYVRDAFADLSVRRGPNFYVERDNLFQFRILCIHGDMYPCLNWGTLQETADKENISPSSGHEVRRRPSLARVHQTAPNKGAIMATIQILTQIPKVSIICIIYFNNHSLFSKI